MSASNSSLEREIDKYQDMSPGSGKGSTSNSSDSSSSDEHYLSRVPGFPLKDF